MAIATPLPPQFGVASLTTCVISFRPVPRGRRTSPCKNLISGADVARFLLDMNPATLGNSAPGYGGIPIHSTLSFSATSGNTTSPLAVKSTAVHSATGEDPGSEVPRGMSYFHLRLGIT